MRPDRGSSSPRVRRRGSVAASCWRRSAAGRCSSTSSTRWPRPGWTRSSSSSGMTPPRSRRAIAWRDERRVVNPDPERGLSSSLQVGFEAVPADGQGRARRPRRPAARLRRGDPRRCSTARPTRPGRSSCRPMPTSAAVTRSCSGARRSASSPRRPAIAGSARCSAAHPELVAEVAGRRATNPDVDTRDDLARVVEAAWAPARPRQPRAGRAHPRGPRRGGLLRAGQLALPGRPDPDRRSRPGRPARARPVGRHVARRRRGRRPLRAADRPGARPVGRFGRRARRVALDARGTARDRRGLRDRERPDRRGALAAGRPERRAASTKRMSRSSRTSATTSRRSGRSSTRSRRRPAGSASPSSWSACRPRRPIRSGRRSTARHGSRCRPCPTSSSCSRHAVAGRGSRMVSVDARRFETRDVAGGVHPAPALDRSGRTEGGPAPGGARRADCRRTATAGRSRAAAERCRGGDWTPGPP